MLKGLSKVVKYMLASQGLYTFPVELTSQYNVLFVQALGASGSDIGLINSVSSSVQSALSMPIGLAIEKFSFKKMMLLGLICDIMAMTIFVAAAHLQASWCVLIPAFILYFQLIRHLPLADLIFVSFTEPGKKVTVMGFARLLRNAVSLAAPMVAALIVTYFGGISPAGILPLFFVALAMFLLLFFLTLKYLSEVPLRKEKSSASLKSIQLIRECLDFFKDIHVRRWIVIKMLARDGFQNMLTIFAPLWIVNVKGATPYVLGIVGTLSRVADMLMQVPAGKLADKIGKKKVYVIFTMFYCLGVVTLIWSPSLEYLLVACILGGTAGSVIGGIGGVAFTSFITLWWEAVPLESRGKMYGLDNLLLTISRIPSSILGGILWDMNLKMFTLLIPILVELLIVVPLLCKAVPNN